MTTTQRNLIFLLVCCLASTGAVVSLSAATKDDAALPAPRSSSPELARAVVSVPPQSAPAPTPGKSPMVFPWDQLNFNPSKDGDHLRQAFVFKTPTRNLFYLSAHVSQLAPGEANHLPHRHLDEDEVVMILEGTMEVYVNGITQIVGPRSMMLFMQDDWHQLKNVGKETATYALFHIYPKKPRIRKPENAQ